MFCLIKKHGSATGLGPSLSPWPANLSLFLSGSARPSISVFLFRLKALAAALSFPLVLARVLGEARGCLAWPSWLLHRPLLLVVPRPVLLPAAHGGAALGVRLAACEQQRTPLCQAGAPCAQGCRALVWCCYGPRGAALGSAALLAAGAAAASRQFFPLPLLQQ